MTNKLCKHFLIHLIATVVDKDFQHRWLLATCIQRRQIIEGGVHWSISPVLKLAWQMTNFLIFDLTSDNVLKHLEEHGEADLLTFDLDFNITACRNVMMKTCCTAWHTDVSLSVPLSCPAVRPSWEVTCCRCWALSPGCSLGRAWHSWLAASRTSLWGNVCCPWCCPRCALGRAAPCFHVNPGAAGQPSCVDSPSGSALCQAG